MHVAVGLAMNQKSHRNTYCEERSLLCRGEMSIYIFAETIALKQNVNGKTDEAYIHSDNAL